RGAVPTRAGDHRRLFIVHAEVVPTSLRRARPAACRRRARAGHFGAARAPDPLRAARQAARRPFWRTVGMFDTDTHPSEDHLLNYVAGAAEDDGISDAQLKE